MLIEQNIIKSIFLNFALSLLKQSQVIEKTNGLGLYEDQGS